MFGWIITSMYVWNLTANSENKKLSYRIIINNVFNVPCLLLFNYFIWQLCFNYQKFFFKHLFFCLFVLFQQLHFISLFCFQHVSFSKNVFQLIALVSLTCVLTDSLLIFFKHFFLSDLTTTTTTINTLPKKVYICSKRCCCRFVSVQLRKRKTFCANVCVCCIWNCFFFTVPWVCLPLSLFVCVFMRIFCFYIFFFYISLCLSFVLNSVW